MPDCRSSYHRFVDKINRHPYSKLNKYNIRFNSSRFGVNCRKQVFKQDTLVNEPTQKTYQSDINDNHEFVIRHHTSHPPHPPLRGSGPNPAQLGSMLRAFIRVKCLEFVRMKQ